MDLRPIIDTKLFPLLEAVAADSLRDAALFHFDKRNPQQLTAICVYCSILELSHGEIALFDKGQTTALPIVLRSVFEAYADLRALLQDAEYYRNMYASFLEEKLRFLRNVAKSPSNPFLLGVSTGMDVNGEVADLEQEIAKYKSEGRKPLSNFARFDSGGLEHEYQSIYWLLCLESHNNMSALDDRHIEKDGSDYHAVLFKSADPDDLLRILDSLLAVMIDSGMRVHKFLGTDATARYESHQKAFDAIRHTYPKV